MSDVKMKHGEEAQKIPGFLLWQVAKLWQRQLTNTFKNIGLSHTQVILLGNIVRLTQEQKKVTQTMLSEVTKVDIMTTSAVIRALEKKQLIKRIITPMDKRAYYVMPTEEGIAKTYQAFQKLPIAQQQFFRGIEKNIGEFILSLQTIIATNTIKGDKK